LRGLVRQLEGKIEWAGPPGTRVSVSFPEAGIAAPISSGASTRS
jgi:two-component sensor histidine kinase